MRNNIEGILNANLESTIQSMISRSCIIDYGVITKVIAKGVVYVAVSVADSEEDVRYLTCTLVTVASKTLTVDIVPKEGDKVIVFYPRKYSTEMFKESNSDVLIKEGASGYNIMSGLAFLCNQFKTSTHKNYIRSEDGKLEINLAYSEDDDKNLLSVRSNKDGSVNIASNDTTISLDSEGAVNITSPKATVDLDADGYLSYSNTGDNKTHLTFTSSGMSLQDANGCKLESTDVSIKINEKLEIKKK